MKIKSIFAVMSMLAITVLVLPSCGGEDDEMCKVSVVSGEGGTATASETEVMPGWEVTLTAQPETDYRFVNWTVNGVVVSTENPYTTTVAENTQFKANFKNIYSGGDNNGGDEDVVTPDIVEGALMSAVGSLLLCKVLMITLQLIYGSQIKNHRLDKLQ